MNDTEIGLISEGNFETTEQMSMTVQANMEGEYTGSHSSYYDVTIDDWTNPEYQQDAPVTICCNDIIEALGMNYAQGNAFKALWRIAAAKQGKLKKGNDTVYDAEKIDFFADRILKQEKHR